MTSAIFGIVLSLFGGNEIVYAQEPEPPRVVQIRTETEEESIERQIREMFPEDPERAVEIAKCESSLNPKAVSHTNDHGLMQLNLTVHEERITEMGIDVYDVEDNLRFARLLYDERQWRPWVCNNLI